MIVELLLIIVSLLLFYILWNGNRDSPNFPKGPRRIPIFGNLHQIGREPQRTFMNWKDKHGEIFSVKLGSVSAVVLNNYKDIRNCLNQSVSAGRPSFLEKLTRNGGTPRGLVFNSGQGWQEQRRFTLKTLRDFGFGKRTMESIVHEEIKELIETFRQDAGKPIQTHTKFNAAVLNALWTITTGQRFTHNDPDLLFIIEMMAKMISQTNMTGIYLFFPWLYKLLSMLPDRLNGFRNESHSQNLELVRKAITEHEQSFQVGAPPRDFIDCYLEEIRRTTDPKSSFYKEEGYENLAITVVDLFIAGAETTSTTLSWIFLLLAMHPEAQEKMFQEIQQVVGLSRLPVLADRPMMPYTEAVINECQRFASITPLAAFHVAVEDMNIKGYSIPKGTVIIPNIYGAMRDGSFWNQPESFQPERFLSSDGKSVTKPEALMPFSVGKRICPGTVMARTFRVSGDPNSPDLKIDYYPAAVLIPKPQNLILYERNKI